jgi:hypothetical protein
LEEKVGSSGQSRHLKFPPKSFGVYGGWAVLLVDPVGPVDVDAIWLLMESIRYIDSTNDTKKHKIIFQIAFFILFLA